MSDIIRLLPDSVANQIAAGEVIQRPASVLKELVENAVDAGATSIQIVMKDAGRTLIQVTDNGKGMSGSDARMAFERHATSKIADAADLFSIRTMGFRGEALASIAAVAQVELRSRREEDELGTLIEIAGSRIFKQEHVQCPYGTTFQVKNLFFNVPARRRFLKSDSVEKNHLLAEFYRIVLVNPQIEFSLYDGDDEIFQLPVSNVKVRIEQVFGSSRKKISQQLLTIETQTGIVNINGFISRPEFAQKHAHQYFFVNGRYMRHPYFHKAVMLAYNQLIQPTDNPAYFIFFETDPQTIDINIHPTKTEIKFESEQAIWSILSAAVKEALGKFNVVPSIDFDREGAPDIPLHVPGTPVSPPKMNFNPDYNPFTNSSSYKRAPVEWEKLYSGFESTPEPEQTTLPFQPMKNALEAFSSNVEEEFQGSYFQLKNKYIITSVKSGMLMIDQRRAHIRILSDQFLAELKQRKGFSQQLLFPEELSLMPEDDLFFANLKPELVSTGFDFETLGKAVYSVKGVPAQLQDSSNVVSIIQQIIEQAKQATDEGVAVIRESISLKLAEASAIRSGQKLSQDEMANLVDRLFACEMHHYTPDGKTVMVILSEEEMISRFK